MDEATKYLLGLNIMTVLSTALAYYSWKKRRHG